VSMKMRETAHTPQFSSPMSTESGISRLTGPGMGFEPARDVRRCRFQLQVRYGAVLHCPSCMLA
jgi:hypothetical protein